MIASTFIYNCTSKKSEVNNVKLAHNGNRNYDDTDVISDRVLIKVIKLNTIRFYKELNSDNNIKDSSKFDNGNFLPKGFCIADYAVGRLNNDTLSDLAILITKTDLIYDYKLIVFLKNSDNTYLKSLETSHFVYGNEVHLSIGGHILYINTDNENHGSTLTETKIRFLNNDWYCVRDSLRCFDSANAWVNVVDFEKGTFKISHEIEIGAKRYNREIKGLIDKKGFLPFMKIDFNKFKYANYKGKLYGFGTYNLWTDDEIEKMIKNN